MYLIVHKVVIELQKFGTLYFIIKKRVSTLVPLKIEFAFLFTITEKPSCNLTKFPINLMTKIYNYA